MRGGELGRVKDLILISRIIDVSKGTKVKVISDVVRHQICLWESCPNSCVKERRVGGCQLSRKVNWETVMVVPPRADGTVAWDSSSGGRGEKIHQVNVIRCKHERERRRF